MNKKFFVPCQTAKLLKEKGYPQGDSDMYYDPNGKLFTKAELDEGYKEDYPIMITYYFAAPNYHEVLDWLEGRKVRIYAEYCNGGWYRFIDNNSETMEIEATVRYQTREEAINDGILKALEML